MVDSCDVAVIGAGFAGAIAARDLGIAGRSVILLEARDRVGGRTYTDEAFGRQLDFGGAYVHWTQPHMWRRQHGLCRTKCLGGVGMTRLALSAR